MTGRTKILLVDDHQLILEGILSYLKDIDGLEIETANSCDEAFHKIKSSLQENPFHIIFTDLSFDNQYNNRVLDSGESLIKAICKEEIPIKVGVITGHSETNRIFNVIHNLNPLAYILKGKCSTDELTFAIRKMLKDEIYYTHEIHEKLLKRALVEIQMDDIAIQILKELPKHAKIANLEGLIKKEDGSLVKVRSIESKLSKLRADLQVNNNTHLVLKAKELGIVD
ncbi:response regulator [Tenacibaculum tangerinum]|uniref:Response regulator n=1 Tax=Tenacibaculum tangerinum TaxID=3038772 RepID=A0ABY8L368_9FLAO|nr:response regulator [Tenacibaculum tangerinum]WGH74444.1 response regulator [Tenacibaculum tangerinum]